MTPEEIAILLGTVPQATKDQIDAKIDECLAKLSWYHPTTTLIKPTVTYDLKGQVAGQAFYHKNLIRLNAHLLSPSNPHYHDMINATVPHELAHLAVYQIYHSNPHNPNNQALTPLTRKQVKPHGREWQLMMHYLGLPANRCHNYDVKPARKRKPTAKPYTYYCGCAVPHDLHRVTATIARRISQGTVYSCKDCGQPITNSNSNGRY